jgi:hypothetical protein
MADAAGKGMAHVVQGMQKFWHDHAGARWLTPMMALLAILVLAVAYMLVYPYVSA